MMMYYKLRNDILRRDEDILQFYYKSIGLIVKKRRKELKLTQEFVAKGICSNTYVSKIENNQIDVNKENLYMIMEKINLPMESISFPEEMLDYLIKSLECFFYKDLDGFTQLYQEMEKYQYGVLIFISRMGYHILKEDYQKAEKIHDDMYHYLSSLEDFGFSAFLIYSCFYNIGIGNFIKARKLVESLETRMPSSQIFNGLLEYAKFLIFGNIHLFNKSRDSLAICSGIFMNTENIRRINDLFVWKNVFAIYEDESVHIPFNHSRLDYLFGYEKNVYLLTLLINNSRPRKLLKYFDNGNWLYQLGYYFVAKKMLENNKISEYEKYLKIIQEEHYRTNCPFDLGNMLILQERDQMIEFKDYLINVVLPYIYKKQNVFFMHKVTELIVDILSKNKRYKDSLSYYRKNQERIVMIQQ